MCAAGSPGRLLRRAAFALQIGTPADADEGAPNRVPLVTLSRELSDAGGIDATRVEALLRHSHERSLLLVEHAHDAWGFHHKTFQEYLCAEHLLAEISDDDAQRAKAAASTLVDHLGESHWRVVWALATDDQGISQPMLVPGWNPKGYLNNAMQRIAVKVV